MTNLRLPNLSFDALNPRVPNWPARTIAYATTVRTVDGVTEVLHHGNTIATMTADRVQVDTCGWDSKTTAHRIDRVLLDNGIPYRCVIRQGRTCLVQQDDLRRVIVPNLTSAQFTLEPTGWLLRGMAVTL